MIRFVDLRGQGTEQRFAFWDTVTSRFLSFSGAQAWDTWDGNLVDAIASDLPPVEADAAVLFARLRGLCPQWAFEPDDGKHEERFWVGTCTRRAPHSGPCNGWPCTWAMEQLEAEAAT